MKKLTTEEFIKKAKLTHGDKYDYSISTYTLSKNKIKIICKTHGEFEQPPAKHLYGYGCGICGGTQKLTKKEFIRRSNKKHNNKYNYSDSIYITTKLKIEIICSKHGKFLQIPERHMLGAGCPKCANKNVTTQEFIKKSKSIFGEEYDYSLVEYKNSLSSVKIICSKHGVFYKTPKKHLKGQGCQKCSMSSGEKLVLKTLINNHITFKPQHKFIDCVSPITNLKLKFDFFLPYYKTCIEYNGSQHYKPIKHFGGTKKFKLSKKMDETKEKYCKNRKIPMIIIFKENEDINKYKFVDLYQNSDLILKEILSNFFTEISLIDYDKFKSSFSVKI
jgi:hypothetical protein